MYVIFFILLCIAVTIVVGLTAHFARKEGDDEAADTQTPNQSTGSG